MTASFTTKDRHNADPVIVEIGDNRISIVGDAGGVILEHHTLAAIFEARPWIAEPWKAAE